MTPGATTTLQEREVSSPVGQALRLAMLVVTVGVVTWNFCVAPVEEVAQEDSSVRVAAASVRPSVVTLSHASHHEEAGDPLGDPVEDPRDQAVHEADRSLVLIVGESPDVERLEKELNNIRKTVAEYLDRGDHELALRELKTFAHLVSQRRGLAGIDTRHTELEDELERLERRYQSQAADADRTDRGIP